MTEPEVHFPVKCPVCAEEKLTGFRISIIADALNTGDIRLYSLCHLASWDASRSEIDQIREYLDATWRQKLPTAGLAPSLDDHPGLHGTYGGYL